MQDTTLITLLTASAFLVSVLMSRFYLSVTFEKGRDTLFSKLRGLQYVLPVIALVGTLFFLLTVGNLARALVLIPFAFAAASLMAQLVMTVAVFFDKDTRKKALTGAEAKTLSTTLRVMGVLALFAIKLVHFILKLSAKGNKGGREVWDTRGPWSHHGYEGYTERAERIRGKPFGDHL